MIDAAFWAKVDTSGDCWLWVGSKNSHGYGQMRRSRRPYMAHRYVLILEGQQLGPSDRVDHMCHTPACVRPDHLRVVTNAENMQNRSALNSNNTTGYRGVSFHKFSGKWRAVVMHQGKYVHAGLFTSKEEAAEAARLKRLELFSCNDADRVAS